MREIIQVAGMRCEHCVSKINTFVGEIEGVRSVAVDLGAKVVQVEFELPASVEEIKEAILDAGFEVIVG